MFGKQHNFYHNGILYSFKSAKLDYVLERMPMYLGEKINRYFSYVLSDDFPDELFNDSSVERCSSFRVKYLKRGARSKASKALVKEVAILDYKGNSKDLNTKYVPGLVKNVVKFTRETFFTHIQNGYIKPNHDQVLTKCLLSCNTAISVETPVWTRKQSTLQDFMKKKEEGHLQFAHSFSLTGHIDLLLYEEEDQELVVADYKPEGKFLYSLPQVSTYALILKRVLNLDEIKCLSFNKEGAWYYDPEVVRNEVEEKIRECGNPKLKWRSMLKSI